MINLSLKGDNFVVWSDLQSVGFYEKLGFKESKSIQKLTEKEVKFETNSVFLYFGFEFVEEEDCLHELRYKFK